MQKDLRICDKCDNFEVHPSGTMEKCNANRGDFFIDNYYIVERINGVKTTCKEFKALPKTYSCMFCQNEIPFGVKCQCNSGDI